MSDISRATPRPWRQASNNPQIIVHASSGDAIAKVYMRSRCHPDTELIVKAVNERDELIAALQAMVEAFVPTEHNPIVKGKAWDGALRILDKAKIP